MATVTDEALGSTYETKSSLDVWNTSHSQVDQVEVIGKPLDDSTQTLNSSSDVYPHKPNITADHHPHITEDNYTQKLNITDGDCLQMLNKSADNHLKNLNITAEDYLQNLNLTGDTYLQNLNLTGDTYLQNLNLTSDTYLQNLNLTGDTYLQNLNLTGDTYLQNLNITADGYRLNLNITADGYLQNLNITADDYLQNLNITADGYLQNLNITADDYLQNLYITAGGYLQNLNITADDYLHNLNITADGYLKNLNITADGDFKKLYIEADEYLKRLNSEFAGQVLPAVVVLVVLMVLGAVGNMFVLLVYSRRSKRGTIARFIQALAVFDLLSCCLAIPGEIVDMTNNYTFGSHQLCKVIRTVNLFCTVASGATLVVVAIDRYKRICCPMRRQISPKGAVIILSCCALASMLVSLPTVVIYGAKTVTTGETLVNGTDCSISDRFAGTMVPVAYNGLQMFLFLVGAIALVILYSLVGSAVCTHARQQQIRRRHVSTFSHRHTSMFSSCSTNMDNHCRVESNLYTSTPKDATDIQLNTHGTKREANFGTTSATASKCRACKGHRSAKDKVTNDSLVSDQFKYKRADLTKSRPENVDNCFDRLGQENPNVRLINSTLGSETVMGVGIDVFQANCSLDVMIVTRLENPQVASGVDAPYLENSESETGMTQPREADSKVEAGMTQPCEADSKVGAGMTPPCEVDSKFGAGMTPPCEVDSKVGAGMSPPCEVDSRVGAGMTPPCVVDSKVGAVMTPPCVVDSKVGAGMTPPCEVDSKVGAVLNVSQKKTSDTSTDINLGLFFETETHIKQKVSPGAGTNLHETKSSDVREIIIAPEITSDATLTMTCPTTDPSQLESSETMTQKDLHTVTDTSHTQQVDMRTSKRQIQHNNTLKVLQNGGSEIGDNSGNKHRLTSDFMDEISEMTRTYSMTGADDNRNKQGEDRRTNRKERQHTNGTKRTTSMLLLITIVYILSFLPHLVLMTIKALSVDSLRGLGASWELAENLLIRSYFINSMINPIVYSFFSKHFFRDCRKSLRCCQRKKVDQK